MTKGSSDDEEKIKSINETLRENEVLKLRDRVRTIEEEMSKLGDILKELSTLVDDIIKEKLEP